MLEQQLQSLLTQWEYRVNTISYSEEYLIGIRECLQEVKALLYADNNIDSYLSSLPSEEAQQYLDSLQADYNPLTLTHYEQSA